jgi:hypothetical protein
VPASLQQLARQIVHTQVSLKSQFQHQAELLLQYVNDTHQEQFCLDDALIANPRQDPIVLGIGIRLVGQDVPKNEWSNALTIHREQIKIIFKKHEMRLRHLTQFENKQAKIIYLFCQLELFKLLLKESLYYIDQAATALYALLEHFTALDQTNDAALPTVAPEAILHESTKGLHQHCQTISLLMAQLKTVSLLPQLRSISPNVYPNDSVENA